MPCRIRWERHGVYRRFFGVITLAEFREANREMRTDVRYGGIRYIISDYLEAQAAPDITERDLKAYSELESMTRDLHRSFVVHEVTHAVLESNFGAKSPPLAQEYVGYVAQFGTMEPGLRSRILAEYDVTPFERESQINVDLYMMDPSAFGVIAWLHYRLPGNGPAFMSRILRRDVF